MSDRFSRYTISIEYNSTPGDWPVTVSLERLGETKEFHGKSRESLLRQAMTAIKEEEKSEGY